MKKILLTALMAILAISAQAQKHWTNNPHLYANTMTVVGVVVINDAEIPRESIEVGAFCNGECRGSERLLYKQNVDRYLAYLSISGANGDVISFRLYDEETEVELQATAATVTFEANAMLGRAGDPYVFGFTTTVDEVPIVAETNEVGATGAGGEVVGEGSYLYGEECTLTAVPDSGCYFLNWTENVDRAAVVVSTDRVYTFVVTGKRDLVANFTATNPAGMEQSLDFDVGWNWISSYVECSPDLLGTLQDGIGSVCNKAMIKNMTSSSMLQNGNWSSGLTFENESMYMVNLPTATSVTLTAPRALASLHPVTLIPGWNWIGFPSDKPMTLGQALSSLTPNKGDLIKSMENTSSYSGGEWQGSLENLVPGEGYMYYNASSDLMTLVYPDLTPPVQGTVEVPEGMDASQIVVTNFLEEVVPNEDGEFEIGYSNLIMARNSINDKIVYFSINSRDAELRDVVVDDYQLNAKETALAIAMNMLPIRLGSTSTELLAQLKNVLYSLPCVQSLESQIQDIVAEYGYLEENVLSETTDAVKTFFYNEIGVYDESTEGRKMVIIDDQERLIPDGLEHPHFLVDEMHGTKMVIDEEKSQYYPSPEHWSITCTGYNGLATCFGVLPGRCDPSTIGEDGSVDVELDENATIYFLPPTQLSKVVDIMTFQDWDGLKQFMYDIWHGLFDLDYYETWSLASLSDMHFDLYRETNVIGFISGMDDARVFVANLLFVVVDFMELVTPDIDKKMLEMVDYLLEDPEFTALLWVEIHKGWSGMRAIYNSMVDKILQWVANKVEEGALKWVGKKVGTNVREEIGEFAETLLLIGEFAHGADALLLAVGERVVESYGLPIQAGFSSSDPIVETRSIRNVKHTSATARGKVVNAGGYGISERGFIYATDPEALWLGNVGSDGAIYSGSSTTDFSCQLTGLYPGETHYYRAYVIDTHGAVFYGDIFDFNTIPDGIPEVATLPVDNITSASACVHGTLTEGDLQVVTDAGFIYGLDPDVQGSLIASDLIAYEGDIVDDYTCILEDLTPGSTYYVVAYVRTTNNLVLYGEEVSFTVPTFYASVIMDQVSVTSGTSAFFSANATIGQNSTPIIERGFIYGTEPTGLWYGSESDHAVYQGEDPIGFSREVDGLWEGTTYYVRAYAKGSNAADVCYSDVESFTAGLGDNLVYNGDFELGNTGFETSYIYGSTGSYNHYYIGHDIAEMWSWDSPGFPVNDHTSGSGLFLMVDGALSNNTIAWSQTVNVTPNTDYEFSAWFLTDNMGYLKFEINDVSGPDFTTPADRWVWEQRSMTWNSGENTSATIKIINRYAQSGGYDWCVDDIYFGAVAGSGGGNTGNTSEGALNGAFTVNANGDQVYFSQGNLQYQASTNTWRFAENQWDYVGTDNANISQTYSGWIDLFGWGTSGWDNGNTYYRPWDSDNSNGSLYGPPGQYNLTGSNANADWGVYNPISNGVNQAGLWRTLTHEEWSYVFNTRSTPSGIRYAKAKVNNVNGVILLPDDWSSSFYSLSDINNSGASFGSNTITASQWNTLEQHGAVFLPAAGGRGGTSVDYVGSDGYYWAASYHGSHRAWIVYFSDSDLSADYSNGRCNGLSVRLVRSAQ